MAIAAQNCPVAVLTGQLSVRWNPSNRCNGASGSIFRENWATRRPKNSLLERLVVACHSLKNPEVLRTVWWHLVGVTDVLHDHLQAQQDDVNQFDTSQSLVYFFWVKSPVNWQQASLEAYTAFEHLLEFVEFVEAMERVGLEKMDSDESMMQSFAKRRTGRLEYTLVGPQHWPRMKDSGVLFAHFGRRMWILLPLIDAEYFHVIFLLYKMSDNQLFRAEHGFMLVYCKRINQTNVPNRPKIPEIEDPESIFQAIVLSCLYNPPARCPRKQHNCRHGVHALRNRALSSGVTSSPAAA
ncbi:hypothetical protein B0H14DRAFT_2580536 [Mycena olivaceomarginata]|nr:hypothetical protein B0H14DRAFT_2580536 [Mycena olivaceomarginata]